MNPFTLTDNHGFIVCPNCRRNVKSVEPCTYCGYSEKLVKKLAGE